VQQLLDTYGLLAVVGGILLTPFGLPIPEELLLMSAGMLTGRGLSELPRAIPSCLGAMHLADLMTWLLGRRIGLHPRGLLSYLVTLEDLRRVEHLFQRYGGWALVFGRQVPGLRSVAIFFAGASGIPYRRFLPLDLLSAAITASLYITVGHLYADDFAAISAAAERYRSWIVGGLGALFALFLARLGWRRLRAARAGADPRG
jgi:membrane protein DedA with SNARE-associated domain